MKRLTLKAVSVVLLSVSLFCSGETELDRKKWKNFWFATAELGINAGVHYFATDESDMYEIKGYMQQNPVLSATVNAAYQNWDKVIINVGNAHLYNGFFSQFLPKMQEVMYNHSNQTGILINENTYNLAMQIINEHSDITDPDFVNLKNQIINDLNVLKNQNYSAVRAWFRGELY